MNVRLTFQGKRQAFRPQRSCC